MVNEKKELRHTRHATFDIKLHLIFVTKFRKEVFNNTMLEELKVIFNNILSMYDCELIEYNGESDHIHILISMHPAVSISTLVNMLKGVSSRRLRSTYPLLSMTYYDKDIGIWSRAYYCTSVGGANLDVLIKYIQSQNHPL